MRVLIVEDDAEFLDVLSSMVGSLAGSPEVDTTRSRTAAISLLAEQFYDLLILDLRIPSSDGFLDASTEHGRNVFTTAHVVAPGMPIFVLTGSSAEDFIGDLLKQQTQVDIWGEGTKVGTVDFLRKSKLDVAQKQLASLAYAVNSLWDVELTKAEAVALSVAEDRLIRIFAKRRNGRKCKVEQLGGGLSAAKVLRLDITDHLGVTCDSVIAKIGSRRLVSDETERYAKYVTRLVAQATPRKLEKLEYGAKDISGVFYGLAEGYDHTIFGLLHGDSSKGATAVSQCEKLLVSWSRAVPEGTRTVRQIRQRLLSDKDAEKLVQQFDLKWANNFEDRAIQVRWCCIHGDLHGQNVLVNTGGTPVIIDYGDVGEGAASLDPLTLEMSVLFHPSGEYLCDRWPNHEAISNWGNLTLYKKDCPYGEFLEACRKWANAVAAGQRELAASAYAYLLRQLKYPDTDKSRAMTLLNAVYAHFKNT